MSKIIELLRYPSTYSGLAKLVGVIAGFLSWSHGPQVAAAIGALGVGISGAINVFFSDADVPNSVAK